MKIVKGLIDDFSKTHGGNTRYLLKDKLDLLHQFKNFDGKIANYSIKQLHNPLHTPRVRDLFSTDFNMSANIKEDSDMGMVFIDELKEI